MGDRPSICSDSLGVLGLPLPARGHLRAPHVRDLGGIQHTGGISPAWPISYADMEPYYTQAEELFHVHGDLGTALKWRPPFPDMEATFRVHSKKAINDAVSAVNARGSCPRVPIPLEAKV